MTRPTTRPNAPPLFPSFTCKRPAERLRSHPPREPVFS
jgi:hypothetical protein